MKIRIGQGMDVHAFCPGDHVILGGVRIPHTKAIDAHSDGDVVLHALCDALLGAAALGDIGRHFPSSEPEWEGAHSRDLLLHVLNMIQGHGWAVVNVDITIVCEKPRIAPYVAQMQKNIAKDLVRSDSVEDMGLTADDISIKATTTEGLGFCGRGEGIYALAVVLIKAW